MNFGPQTKTKLDGQGKARREAARRRNFECKINLSSPNSSRSNGSTPTAHRWLAGSVSHWSQRRTASQSPLRCRPILPLPREKFRQLNLILHSELRRRAASRRALPCPSSFIRCVDGLAIIWNSNCVLLTVLVHHHHSIACVWFPTVIAFCFSLQPMTAYRPVLDGTPSLDAS